MANSWFYRSRGQLSGPIDFEELAQLAAGGTLQPADELRRGEQGDWMPAGSIAGLFPEPEELQDLSDLNFQFVESGHAESAASTLADQIATLDDLNIQVVSEPAVPKQNGIGNAAATVTVDEPATDGWFYQSLGQERGPMPLDELVRLACEGMISADDAVRCGSTGAWQRAARVEELAKAVQRAQAALQPPVGRSASGSPAVAHPDQPAKDTDDSPADDNGESYSDSAPAMAEEPDLPPPPPPAATEPTDRWFCRIDGIEHGPLTRDELAAMAQHDRIKPETQVKQEDDGAWTIAGVVEGLFAEAPGPAAIASPSASPAYVPPKPKKEKKKRQKRVRGPREPLMPRLKALVASNKPVVFGGLGLVVVAAIVLLFAVGGSASEVEYLNRMKSILDEYKELKKRKAPPAEWESLLAEANALKAEIHPILAKTASAQKPELQELLWASEDMIDMLSGRGEISEYDERKFVRHLVQAAELLNQPSDFAAGTAAEKKPQPATKK